MAGFDDDTTPIPPGFLHDPSRTAEGARERDNEMLRLWEENRALKEEVEGLRVKCARLVLEVNKLRKIHRSAEEEG